MATSFILGLDPGISGALALFNPETKTLEAVLNFPLTNSRSSKSKKEINCEQLFNFLLPYKHQIKFAVIENIHSRPGQSSVSTFRFGESFGMLKALLQAHCLPTHYVYPNYWKPLFKLSPDKKDSIALANKLFPGKFKLLKDHNMAEAALLAVFGSLYFKSIPISDSRGGVAEY